MYLRPCAARSVQSCLREGGALLFVGHADGEGWFATVAIPGTGVGNGLGERCPRHAGGECRGGADPQHHVPGRVSEEQWEIELALRDRHQVGVTAGLDELHERHARRRSDSVEGPGLVLLDEQDDESGEVTHVDYLNWPIQPVGDRNGTRACGTTYPIGEQLGPFMRPDHPPGANDAEPLAELSGEGILASHLQRAVTVVIKEFRAQVAASGVEVGLARCSVVESLMWNSVRRNAAPGLRPRRTPSRRRQGHAISSDRRKWISARLVDVPGSGGAVER
jgi:hypothetical protein